MKANDKGEAAGLIPSIKTTEVIPARLDPIVKQANHRRGYADNS